LRRHRGLQIRELDPAAQMIQPASEQCDRAMIFGVQFWTDAHVRPCNYHMRSGGIACQSWDSRWKSRHCCGDVLHAVSQRKYDRETEAPSMSQIRYISSLNEIPAGHKYVLVRYGEKNLQTEHPLGLTITVARTVSQLSFLTAVHTAREIATHAGIPDVFVCTASTPGPNSTPSGMFIYVPADDELSSNVVGLNVYNDDKQNIGTIKDIALDANGLNGYIVDVGNFLGMGDQYVVVRPSAISFNVKDNTWHATMNVNADQLRAAPVYKYSSRS
jgi:PRC-barrel domain